MVYEYWTDYNYGATGYFGSVTEASLVRFQTSYMGLGYNDIYKNGNYVGCGPATSKALSPLENVMDSFMDRQEYESVWGYLYDSYKYKPTTVQYGDGAKNWNIINRNDPDYKIMQNNQATSNPAKGMGDFQSYGAGRYILSLDKYKSIDDIVGKVYCAWNDTRPDLRISILKLDGSGFFGSQFYLRLSYLYHEKDVDVTKLEVWQLDRIYEVVHYDNIGKLMAGVDAAAVISFNIAKGLVMSTDDITKIIAKFTDDFAKAIGKTMLKSFDDIVKNPKSLWGKSADDVAKILGNGWTRGTYGSNKTGWKFTNGDKSIFYHPGGGQHVGSYYGFSSGKLGKNKIVGPDYKPLPGDKANIIYVN